jgi:hypothetical protein
VGVLRHALPVSQVHQQQQQQQQQQQKQQQHLTV